MEGFVDATALRDQMRRAEACLRQKELIRQALIAYRDDLDQDDSINSFTMSGNCFWLESRGEAWFEVSMIHDDWSWKGWGHVFEPLAEFDRMFGNRMDPIDAYGFRACDTINGIVEGLW